MRQPVNLTFRLGTTWGFDVPALDINGNPVALDGKMVRWRLVSPRRKILDLTINDGIRVDAPASGVALIDVTPAMQSAAGLKPGVYEHSLVIEDQTGVRDEFVMGTINVQPTPFSQFP